MRKYRHLLAVAALLAYGATGFFDGFWSRFALLALGGMLVVAYFATRPGDGLID